MVELSFAVGLVVAPLTFVLRTICPYHGPVSVSETAFPLAIVHSTGLVCERFQFDWLILLVHACKGLM